MRPEPKPPADTRRRTMEHDTRQYRFLTYVMGGGVQTKEHEKLRDPVTPVRAASLRGQLRFWWRACNPSGCTTLEELRQREAEIWGATSRASQVIVDVLKQPGAPTFVQVYEYNNGGRIAPIRGMREIAYGAFPLQPDRDAQAARKNPGVLFDYGTRPFEIRFSYPKTLEADVTAALRAWETFGGLGARTRRGFGAVLRMNESPSPERVRAALQTFRSSERIPGVPSLAGAKFEVARTTASNPVEAWKQALRVLQDLRQKVDLGRNQSHNGKPAGRSRWPEPDEIRRITKRSAGRHSRPVVTVERFPRARFGLPIVFHFEAGRDGDPDFKPLQIHPVDHDRFPSPLVLRPLPDGDRYWPSALALSVQMPDVALTFGKETQNVKWELDQALASQIRVMNDMTPSGPRTFIDPIDRFLWELQK